MNENEYEKIRIRKLVASVVAIIVLLVSFPIVVTHLLKGIDESEKNNTQVVQTEVIRKYEKFTEGLFVSAKTEYYIEIEFEGEKKAFPVKQAIYDQIGKNDLVTATVKYGEIDSITREE